MTATLKDVALRAGVSVRTVSNVVNGYTHVTEEMRERVQAAIDDLKYQPNLSARYLRKGRTGVIAYAIPDIGNVYFSDIGRAVISAATAQSYTVLIDSTGGEEANEQLVVSGLRPHLIDGVILSHFALRAEDLIERKNDIPLVLLSDLGSEVPYDNVTIDNVAAAHLATKHLLSLGRRRVAVIGIQETKLGETEVSLLRLRGYSDALREAGIPFDPTLIVRNIPYYGRTNGAHAIRQLMALDNPPDAVFCFNDHLALGALRALLDAGYSVPEDVAVVGFDDIEDGRFSNPSLTTIAPDKEMMGNLVVSLLTSRINGTRTSPPQRIEVSFELIVRESTVGRRTSTVLRSEDNHLDDTFASMKKEMSNGQDKN